MRFSDHDVELDGLGSAGKKDLLGDAEAEFGVDDWVDGVATFKVTGAVLGVSLFGGKGGE